jgi:hypothetical protein
LPIGGDESLLGGVLGQVEIAEHTVRAPECHILKARYQLAERRVSLTERAANVNGLTN